MHCILLCFRQRIKRRAFVLRKLEEEKHLRGDEKNSK